MKPYRMGFVGASTDEVCYWLRDNIPKDIETIAIPFLGSGRSLSILATNGRIIESWDQQYLSRVIVEGIFQATEPTGNVTEPKMQKGYVYETRCFPGIDERSAGLIDYIAAHGTLYEHAALTTAIIRSTFRGRIAEWDENSTATTLWEKFQKRLGVQLEYLNLPAEFTHHEGNFYDYDHVGRIKGYDLLVVDPPKIISSADIYSTTFAKLNYAIGADPGTAIAFDKWTKYDYFGKVRKLLETKSKYLTFEYTTGVQPTVDEIKVLLDQYGELMVETRTKHRNRYDYVLLYDRR